MFMQRTDFIVLIRTKLTKVSYNIMYTKTEQNQMSLSVKINRRRKHHTK